MDTRDEATAGEAAGLAASAGTSGTPGTEPEVQQPGVGGEKSPGPGVGGEKSPGSEATIRQKAVDCVNGLRYGVKVAATNVKLVRLQVAQAQHDNSTDAPENLVADDAEFYANMMLAYRCLEDASMRLGKAIQAADGGVSVYDRETTVGA